LGILEVHSLLLHVVSANIVAQLRVEFLDARHVCEEGTIHPISRQQPTEGDQGTHNCETSSASVDMEEVLNAEQVFEPERAIQVPDMLSGQVRSSAPPIED
jgi:hypothetical protein